MADKLMQDINEIKSSSETEQSVTAQVAEQERKKKDEIMANLKHLNMLGNVDYGATSPSEVPEITSNISRKDNPSSPNSDNVLSGTHH